MSVTNRLAALSPEQRALFDTLRRRRPAATPRREGPPPIAAVSGPAGTGDWPLSFDQARLFRMHQEDPDLVSWNVDAGSRVWGEMDLPAFLAAIHLLVRRHAAWRTVFPLLDGEPVQRVLPFLAPEVGLVDLSGLPAERREATAHAAIYDHTRRPFDLARGPLLRMALLRLSLSDHLYMLTIHHLVTDWISFQIFFQGLVATYEDLRAGRPPALPEPPVQFPDFVLWEREWLSGEHLAAEREHWRRQLAGFPLVLDLPADRPRPAVQSQRGGMLRVAAGAMPSERLRALARREGATTFMALLALVAATLNRLTGRERLIVGSNAANRVRPESQPVAGLFLTQVPFAVDVSGDPTFLELLARSRAAALAAYAHANLPVALLIETMAGGGGDGGGAVTAAAAAADRSRHPIVQVLLLVLEPLAASTGADLTFEPVGLFDGNSRWDLMFGLYDDRERGITGVVEYNADIFERPTVERTVALLLRLLAAATADPALRLSELPA